MVYLSAILTSPLFSSPHFPISLSRIGVFPDVCGQLCHRLLPEARILENHFHAEQKVTQILKILNCYAVTAPESQCAVLHGTVPYFAKTVPHCAVLNCIALFPLILYFRSPSSLFFHRVVLHQVGGFYQRL